MAANSPNAFRLFDRLLEVAGIRWLVWVLFTALMFQGALSVDPFRVTAHYDEHYFFAQDDIARETIVRYHELPAWNPYFCGGVPAAANPQSQAFAPDFLLRILFGTGPGRRLAVLVFVLLGLEGTFRLARRYGASPLGGVTAAVAFAASGRFYFMYQFGWINMFGFQLLPWAILGYDGAARWRNAALGAAALSWMALAGGTYSLPFSVLTLVAVALWDTLAALFSKERGRIRDPFLALVRVGLITALLSAAKLLPMLAIVFEHPRVWTEPSVVGPIGVIESLVIRGGGGEYAGESFIGALLVVGAFVPLFFRDAKVIKPLAIAALFFAFAMGNLGPKDDISLYGVLHMVPVYAQLRNPERYTLIVCLFFALALGRLVVHIEDGPMLVVLKLRERFRRAPTPWEPGRIARFVTGLLGSLAALSFTFAVIDTLYFPNQVAHDLFSQDAPLVAEAPFRQSRGNRWDAQIWPRASMGTLLCFEENPFPQSRALRGDLAAEERAEDSNAATVERTGWTPNSITVSVDAQRDAWILVNQNYDRGWTTNFGELESRAGLLGVHVPAGKHLVHLRYRSTLLRVGVGITLLTILNLIVIGLWRWRARARRVVTRSRDEGSASPPPA